MINTILFDLDGTLLPMDMDRFGKIYFEEMGRLFADIAHPKKLASDIWTATEAMVQNTDTSRTNEEVFMSRFGQLIDGDMQTYTDRFDHFYDNGFLKTRDAVFKMPLINEIIHKLKEKNYNLILATNPLFPQKAIYHRINWAGVHPQDFSYITSFEKNHYCKPRVEFYEEILKSIGKTADECLMVGNDVQEDCVAETLGIKTFLVTNHMLHRTDEAIHCSYRGDYQDFFSFVESLEAVSK